MARPRTRPSVTRREGGGGTEPSLQIEQRQFTVRSELKIKHIAVRERDWTDIKDGLRVCRTEGGLFDSAAFTALGTGLGAILSWLLSPPRDAYAEGICTAAIVGLFAVSAVCLLAARKFRKNAADRVDELKTRMTKIEDDSNFEEPLS